MTAPYQPARDPEDPAAIRADISQTRQRISHDLDELGEKLNPQNVKAQIKDGVREATIGRVEQMARNAGDGMMQTIRSNPIPAAMAGVGLAWLYMSRGSGQSGRSTTTYSSEAGRSGYSNQPYNAESYRYESGQSRLGEVAETVKEKVSGLTEKAQETVSGAASTGGQQVRRVEDTFFENPLAIAAAAIAAGLAVGLMAPETSAERRVLGEASSGLRDKVTEVARETTEKVSTVAQRAVEETKNAARQEGLTGAGSMMQDPAI
jgi:hypothetical protein